MKIRKMINTININGIMIYKNEIVLVNKNLLTIIPIDILKADVVIASAHRIDIIEKNSDEIIVA